MRQNCHKIKLMGIISILLAFSSKANVINEDSSRSLSKEEAIKIGPLPSADELLEATLHALKEKQKEQEQELLQVEKELEKTRFIEEQTFDNQAYLSLSFINRAPTPEYKLSGLRISIDGKAIASSHTRNFAKNPHIFLGALRPGCHEITVEASYVRLKNNLLTLFKLINRTEKFFHKQPFVAKPGYRVQVEIEGFEARNTFANFYRGPELRFNKSVRPNFLKGAAMLSSDEVLQQGRLRVSYVNEGSSNHRLISKSLSIDGLPILIDKVHDQKAESDVVFEAPLKEGKHTLNVYLIFAEKKLIGGGPHYNFKLKFDRDFYVINGQTTKINLTAMPKDGFRSTPYESRYARVSSQIISEQNMDFFPGQSCKEIKVEQITVIPQQEKESAPLIPQVPMQIEEIPVEQAPVESEKNPSEQAPSDQEKIPAIETPIEPVPAPNQEE